MTSDRAEARRGMRALFRLLVAAAPGPQLASALCRVGSDISWPLSAVGLKILVDGVVEGSTSRAALGGAIAIGTTVLGDGLTWATMALHFSLVERVGHAVDQQLMQWDAAIPGVEHHERPDYQDRVQLLRDQRDQLALLPEAAAGVAAMIVRSAIAVVLLTNLHPLLLTLPLFGIPSLFVARRTTRMQLAAAESVAQRQRQTNVFFDLATEVSAAKESRIFGLQRTLKERHGTVWRELDSTLRRTELRVAVASSLGWAVFALGFGASIGFIAIRATRGDATPGDVVMALAVAAQVNNQLSYTLGNISWLQQSLRAATRYLWLADHATEASRAVTPADPQTAPPALRMGIELRGVSFTYPGTTTTVLEEVDAVLPAGATVAVVGDNGAGKTTLVKLLCRLYEPSTGTILVDDVPHTAMTPDSWRAHVSAGFQDFVRFELTAREAVGIGLLDRIGDDGHITGALDRASGAAVIDDLPRGLDSQLGRLFDGGVELSGGQWQKVALGRAMMRPQPLLLVLDEPTAALDAQTEHALFERFTNAAHRVASANGAITLLVSHRFSTVRMADLILVLQDGRIVEQGSHADLIARGGVYAELYELQASSYR